MMQPITLAGMLLCFGVLFLKFRNQRAAKRGNPRRGFRTAKILLSALLALMAIGFALGRVNASIDGTAPEPSFMERVVEAFAK